MADTPMQPQIQPLTEPMTEEELKRRIIQSYAEGMAQQQKQAQALKDMLASQVQAEAELGSFGRLDLRPFAQALKQYGATTVAVPEEAPADTMGMKLKLQQALQESQQGLGRQQLDFLRSALAERQAGKMWQAQQSEQNRAMRAFENVSRKFDKPQQEIADFYQAHDAFKSALEAGDIASVNAALSNYSRMTGEKGVLTDQDIARVISPSLSLKFANLRAKLLSDPTTPVPQEIVTSLSAGLERLREAAEKKVASRIDAAERQAKVGPGEYRIYAPEIAAEARKSIRGSQTPTGGAVMSEAQKKRLEELKAKYGK
jgi:hypothetical protein